MLEGRVELLLFGHWGTVCDERWDHIDAIVVCRQLGYPRAVEAPGSAFFGAGSGPSWYTSVRCTGTERNLTECSKYTHNFGSACPHSQDAGVVCSSECSCGIIVFFTLEYNKTICFHEQGYIVGALPCCLCTAHYILVICYKVPTYSCANNSTVQITG